jgi:hypothetical protein
MFSANVLLRCELSLLKKAQNSSRLLFVNNGIEGKVRMHVLQKSLLKVVRATEGKHEADTGQISRMV